MIDVVLLAMALSTAQGVSTPQLKLDGVPLKMAWSRDDSQIYVATAVSGACDAKVASQYIFLQQMGKHEWTLRVLDLQ